MQIGIKNCNNIDAGIIQIIEKNLNIKYGINGTGKSTVSKAVVNSILDREEGTKRLIELKPFKAIGDDAIEPIVTGIESIKSVAVFDEDYIDEFIFQPDELIKGSFDIFIRDSSYDFGMREIEKMVAETKTLLSQDSEIEALINDFNELSKSFGKPTKIGIHGSSALCKAFKEGNKVANVPPELEVYRDYIQSEKNFKWIRWQLEGQQFIDITDSCPYCVNSISSEKETIERVGQVYKAKAIENLNNLVAIFDRLNEYFSNDTKKILDGFIQNIDGYTDDQVNYLIEIKSQIDRLSEKFGQAKGIDFYALKDVGRVVKSLEDYKIDIDLYHHLKSEKMEGKATRVNMSIDHLLQKANGLQVQVDRQKKKVNKLIKENRDAINSFLRNAGYQYEVNLKEDAEGKPKLMLMPLTLKDKVKNVKACLSHGERNAFALVLFMFDALKRKADLIVLDDPISSFDKNKKYAMAEMLFGIDFNRSSGEPQRKSLRGKTVLLLSHDFEPVVDMIHHHCDHFPQATAHFLENKRGQLTEKEIKKADIQTFIEINTANILSGNVSISQMVYLRRTYEITNQKGMGYHLVSNIFHKRTEPTIHDEQSISKKRPMTQAEISQGICDIQTHIPKFDYTDAMRTVCSHLEMRQLYAQATNNYEKLHLYRIIFDDRASEGVQPSPIEKFINQAFHIETDYMYQLNPAVYQTVPQYVIDECDRLINELSANGVESVTSNVD